MQATAITQNEKYLAALSRAQSEHLEIFGRGTIKATGQTCFAVTASGGGCYIVTQSGDMLSCNCLAAEHGDYCKHRALVTHTLIEEKRAEKVRIEKERAAFREAFQDYYYDC